MGQPGFRLQGSAGSPGRKAPRVPRLKLSVFGEGGQTVSPERFRLELSSRELEVRLPDLTVDERLHEGANTARPGPAGERQRQRTTIDDMSVAYDVRARKLRGAFTADIPDRYPGMSTRAAVRLETGTLDPRSWRRCEDIHVRGEGKYGPARMDFRISLRCDNPAVRKALDSIGDKEPDLAEIVAALESLGIDLEGSVKYLLLRDIPVLNRWLQSRFEAHLEPSIGRKRAHAPGFGVGPLRLELADYNVRGIVPIPAGGIFETWAVGLGKTEAEYHEKSFRTFTFALTPTVNPAPFSANLYLYFDVNRVWRVADGVDLGIRFTVAPEAQKLERIKNVLEGRAAPQLPSRTRFLDEQRQRRRRRMTDPTASPVAGQGVDPRPFLSLKATLTW